MWLTCRSQTLCVSISDAAPRLLQENQKYLSQLTSLMQEAADEQAKSIVVSYMLCLLWETVKWQKHKCLKRQKASPIN